MKKKKNHKLDPAKDFCNNAVQRSVNDPFVSGSQERNNSLKKTNFSSKGFVCNPADRPINEIFVSGGQERNNLSSSKKKKNRELDPAKDYCNNGVERSVNDPFASGSQESNNSSKNKNHKWKVPNRQFVQNPAENNVLGHSGFNTCQSAVVAVERNFPSKFPTVYPHEPEL